MNTVIVRAGVLGVGISAVIAVLGLAGCRSVAPVPVSDRSGSITAVEKSAKSRSSAQVPVASEGATYTVKRGDTLFAIALDQGLDYRELAQWNNLDNPNLVRTGQTLRLTAPGAPTPVVGAEETAQVKPVAAPAPVKSLDDSAAKPAAVPLAIPASTDSATLKRGPKGGTQVYSEAALASQKATDAAYDKTSRTTPVVASDKPATAVPPALTLGASVPAPAPAPAAAPVSAPASAQTPPAATTSSPAALAWQWPVAGKVLTPFNDGSTKGIDLAGKLGDPVLAAAAGKVSYVGSSLRGYGKMVVLKHGGDYLSVYAHNNQILVSEGQSVTAGQKIAELGASDADSPKLHFEVRRQGKPIDPVGILPPR